MARRCTLSLACEYSPIEHLAKTIFMGRWKDGRIAMMTAAFDASGTEHDQIAIVVAGFISSANDWLDFEKAWTARLKVDGIDYFHMVEFAQSNKQFAGWRDQEARRRALLADLLDIISSRCYRKFGCGISIKTWESGISEAHKERFKMTAYGMAGSIAICTVDSWCQSERIRTAPEVVFEDGDLGKGKFQQEASPRKPEPIFRPKKDTVRADGTIVPGFVPLQAADLLAYELLLGIRNWQGGMPRDARYALTRFNDIPGEIKWLEPKDLAELEAMLRAVAQLIPAP